MVPRKIIRISILALAMFESTSVFAGAPAAHWGTFNKNTSACSCHLFARDALRAENLNILDDAGSVLLGGNDKVIAQVACHPGGQQITVSAFSTDSKAAEMARNNVRTRIYKSTLFDTCP